MRQHKLIIAANGQQTLRVSATYAVVKSATGNVHFSTPDGRISLRDIEVGQGFRGIPFVDLIVEDASGATNTVVIVTANNAEVIDVVRVAGSVSLAPSDTLTANKKTVGITATTIAAVTGQQRITLKAKSDNSGNVTVGTTAGDGIVLGAGEGITIDTGATVSLIADAANQVVQYLQES